MNPDPRCTSPDPLHPRRWSREKAVKNIFQIWNHWRRGAEEGPVPVRSFLKQYFQIGLQMKDRGKARVLHIRHMRLCGNIKMQRALGNPRGGGYLRVTRELIREPNVRVYSQSKERKERGKEERKSTKAEYMSGSTWSS